LSEINCIFLSSSYVGPLFTPDVTEKMVLCWTLRICILEVSGLNLCQKKTAMTSELYPLFLHFHPTQLNVTEHKSNKSHSVAVPHRY